MRRVATIRQLNEEWIDQGASARERAERAWNIRHDARLEARSLMADAAEVEMLRQRDIAKFGTPDGPTFDFLVERLTEAGLKGDAVYEAIIDQSYRTDAELDRRLGL